MKWQAQLVLLVAVGLAILPVARAQEAEAPNFHHIHINYKNITLVSSFHIVDLLSQTQIRVRTTFWIWGQNPHISALIFDPQNFILCV